MTFEILTQQVDAREGADVDPLKEFCSHISKSFYKPDIQAARIILAAAFAHYIPDTKPIWMFVVGPPSSGKTSITVEALSGLQGMFGPGQPWGPHIEQVKFEAKNTNRSHKSAEAVEILSTINANTFLSHQCGVEAPGLLEQISGKKAVKEKKGLRLISWGNILALVPDFTVMASMGREKRGEIMGQLRRIYDGKFEKKVGTKETKIWQGKMTLLAATTPIIDKYTSIESSLGERFIQIKWRSSTSPGRLAFGIHQQMKKIDVKTPMKNLVREAFGNAITQQIDLEDDVIDRLSALSELIALARTSVFGSSYEGRFTVSDVGTTEDIWRMGFQFYGILSGLARLQGRDVPTEQDIQDVLRTGIETLNTYRSLVLQAGIEKVPMKAFPGSWREKQKEAACMTELGMIGRVGGESPIPEFKDHVQAVVDRCGFQPGVFVPDGAAAGEKREIRIAEEDKEAGISDEVC